MSQHPIESIRRFVHIFEEKDFILERRFVRSADEAAQEREIAADEGAGGGPAPESSGAGWCRSLRGFLKGKTKGAWGAGSRDGAEERFDGERWAIRLYQVGIEHRAMERY